MKELILSRDKYKMNWVCGRTEWGTVKCDLPLDVKVQSQRDGDVIREEYIFTNNTDRDIFTSLTDIGIYTPFNDEYTNASECMIHKCHTHIWCGGEVSYVMALRMGGEAPHLGLVLTGGSIGGYSVERDLEKMSNDRGDFILHPSPFSLVPGASYSVSWTLFAHNGKEDFYRKAKLYCKKFLDVKADKYIIFDGEEANIVITADFPIKTDDTCIFLNEEYIPFTISDNAIRFTAEPKTYGEQKYQISAGGVKTYVRLLSMPPLDSLVKKRCNFIAQKQQYNNPKSSLDGAYLVYDNEDDSLYYSLENDYNGGRERVGMGILLAAYLQKEHDSGIEESLKRYIDYVKRELVDEETGEVYNDCNRNNSYMRLYNAPWFALFYTELYKLYNIKEYLLIAYRILLFYYNSGGARFYPIELPVVQIINCMKNQNMMEEINTLTGLFICHAEHISEIGTDYPASEVNYEQSIVAPAADILLKVYALTGNEKYINAAKKQLDILELFNGTQPDYHLHEVAIRHWDGFWFGKRKMYGDTFPHYWSALTGNIYHAFYGMTGDERYLKKADASYRGVMSMFMPDGSASCAYVYPVSVNGKSAAYYDPYANDQDWGLYFMIRYKM